MNIKPQIGDIFEHDFFFTKQQVLDFAELSGDKNPVHVSDEFGSQSQFGKCIVHGYFTISIFSKIFGTLLYADEHILLEQSARYLKPIFTEIPHRAIITIKEIFPEKNRILYKTDIVEIKTGELKVRGEALLMNKKYYL